VTAQKTIVGRIDSEVLRFTAGKDVVLDLALAEADCIGSAAHVTMLARLPLHPSLFTPRQRDQVIAALVGIMRAARAGAFRIRERDQDIHLAVERALTRQLGDLGRRIHTARSRNDQVAVDLRLYTRDQMLALITEITGLARVLLGLAARHRAVPMVGRTHLQPAMPSSVGLWASAHAESLLDDLILVKAAYEYNNASPLGSAASYGVPLPIDRALTARLLGFRAPIHNVLYAGNARGKCESVVLSALVQVMLSLSRLAEDLILFTMPEFAYFSLPAEYCTGSSIMPQKRNPDVLELVRARASKVLSCSVGVASLVKGLPSGYNRDLQEAKEPFLEGLKVTRDCVRIMALLLGRLGVDRAALRRGFTPDIFATDRALELVAAGVPFRDAYDTVKKSLGTLEGMDPVQALRRKTHEGAPAGLDLGLLRARGRDMDAYARRAARSAASAISKLLGVKYPELGGSEES
jgi:argininosuccinate lyase